MVGEVRMVRDERLLTVTRSELLSEAEDTAFRAMLYDFFAFGSTLDTARAGFASYVGLTPTQYLSLIVIARADPQAPVGVNQVAARLHLTGAFVTNEINKLAQDGFVEKKPHPSDGPAIAGDAGRLGEAAASGRISAADQRRAVRDLDRGGVRSAAKHHAALGGRGTACAAIGEILRGQGRLMCRGDRAPPFRRGEVLSRS